MVPTICTKKPSLIHSDSTWWWQPSWILPCWIKKTSLIHSDSTWWWQPSWILPCWFQTPCFLLSDSLKNTLPPLCLWLKLIQSDSNVFILTQLDDGSHLEFCHLEFVHIGFSHHSFSSQTHSHLPRLVPTICTKKTSLIHSDSTWWWQPSWILPCWIQTPSYLLSDSLKNTLPPLWLWLKLIQSDSNSFILTQLDDGSHLEFCHLEFGHIGFSHLSFSSQTHSHLPRLVPTICTKKTSLIHSDSTWWWQPSWILPCWIQTPSYLLSDSLKNTLPPLWLWLKLIQSDSNSFILTQLDDGSHLEFCHLEFGHIGFSHLSFSSQTHSHLPGLVPTICTKKPSLIHSDSTWWLQPYWILPCWIQTLPSWIHTPSYLLSDSFKNTLTLDSN